MAQPSIPIYTLSGTGNTLAVTTKMVEEFHRNGLSAKVININYKTIPDEDNQSEWIGIAAPIYGYGVSELVFRFVKKLPNGQGRKIFICLTAGSGDNTTNRNAAGALLNKLERKQYNVPYTRIFAMPSNWYFDYPIAINKKLYLATMEKASHSVNELLKGVYRRPTPSLGVRLLSTLVSIGEDRFGAKMFGRFLKAGNKCIHCGKCARECPSGNITINNQQVRFGWKCIWCMKCIYQCPAQAVNPRHMSFCVLKGNYNLNDIINYPEDNNLSKDEEKKFKLFNSYFNNISI
jgi:ferredoxin/flavodoxin